MLAPRIGMIVRRLVLGGVVLITAQPSHARAVTVRPVSARLGAADTGATINKGSIGTTAAPALLASGGEISIHPAPAYKIQARTEVVLVEATVRDHSGAIVESLRSEDFHVFEDGVEQKLDYFSHDELPLAVALVIDRSGSMGPVLDALRRAASATLSQLKPEDEVALFAFAAQAERLENLTIDRQSIAAALSRISAGGGTNITDALHESASYLGRAAPDRRHAIVLISDNDGTIAGLMGDKDVVKMALESDTSVYSIRVQARRHSRFTLSGFNLTSVVRIARETGGELIDARNASAVPAAMGAVISRLKQRYSLGYTSTNPRRDGRFRQIRVKIGDSAAPRYNVYARQGYFAPVR